MAIIIKIINQEMSNNDVNEFKTGFNLQEILKEPLNI